MKITTYDTQYDNNRLPSLVKEKTCYYPQLDNVNSVSKIVYMMKNVFHAHLLTEEHVWILALTTTLNLIGVFELSHGSKNQSECSPGDIFKKLCLCNAARFALVHCHPSGDCTPSPTDSALTERVRAASKLMGIEMIDHIIIGDDHYSYKEHDLLD